MSLGRTLRSALALAAVTVLAGCGGSSTSSNSSSSATPTPTPSPAQSSASVSPTPVDACSIVMASDVAASLGAGFTSTGAAIPGTCFYTSADGTVRVIVYAQVYANAASANAVSAQQLAASLNLSGLGSAKALTGIGANAVEYSGGSASGNSIVIFLIKNNVTLLIDVMPASSASAVEQLATAAAGHLH